MNAADLRGGEGIREIKRKSRELGQLVVKRRAKPVHSNTSADYQLKCILHRENVYKAGVIITIMTRICHMSTD